MSEIDDLSKAIALISGVLASMRDNKAEDHVVEALRKAGRAASEAAAEVEYYIDECVASR
jgi:hypothetical protein